MHSQCKVPWWIRVTQVCMGWEPLKKVYMGTHLWYSETISLHLFRFDWQLCHVSVSILYCCYHNCIPLCYCRWKYRVTAISKTSGTYLVTKIALRAWVIMWIYRNLWNIIESLRYTGGDFMFLYRFVHRRLRRRRRRRRRMAAITSEQLFGFFSFW